MKTAVKAFLVGLVLVLAGCGALAYVVYSNRQAGTGAVQVGLELRGSMPAGYFVGFPQAVNFTAINHTNTTVYTWLLLSLVASTPTPANATLAGIALSNTTVLAPFSSNNTVESFIFSEYTLGPHASENISFNITFYVTCSFTWTATLEAQSEPTAPTSVQLVFKFDTGSAAER